MLTRERCCSWRWTPQLDWHRRSPPATQAAHLPSPFPLSASRYSSAVDPELHWLTVVPLCRGFLPTHPACFHCYEAMLKIMTPVVCFLPPILPRPPHHTTPHQMQVVHHLQKTSLWAQPLGGCMVVSWPKRCCLFSGDDEIVLMMTEEGTAVWDCLSVSQGAEEAAGGLRGGTQLCSRCPARCWCSVLL